MTYIGFIILGCTALPAGAFGALPLAGQGGHIKTEEKSTDVETEHKENLDNPSVYQIIEILQQKLRGKASLPLHTSSAHQPFLSSHGGATIKNSLNEIPEQWDSVKLVRFRSTRLGLLLAKVCFLIITTGILIVSFISLNCCCIL